MIKYIATPELQTYNAAIASCLHELRTTGSAHREYYLGRGLEKLLVHPEGIPLIITTNERKIYSRPVSIIDGKQELYFKQGMLHVCGITGKDQHLQTHLVPLPWIDQIAATKVPSNHEQLLAELEKIRAGEDKPIRQIVVYPGGRVLARR